MLQCLSFKDSKSLKKVFADITKNRGEMVKMCGP